MVQISVPIQPGNSGGPLINDRAEVIGIVTSTANSYFFVKNRNTIPQNVNFAVKSNYLVNLLTLLPDYQKLETSPQPEDPLSATEIMSRARDSIVLVQSRN
jgi:serine protease Do